MKIDSSPVSVSPFPVSLREKKKRIMATYAAYRHIELDKVGYSKKR